MNRKRQGLKTFRFLEVKKDDINNLLVTPQTATRALKRKVFKVMQEGQKQKTKKSRLLKIIETQIEKDIAIVDNRFIVNSYGGSAPLSHRDVI